MLVFLVTTLLSSFAFLFFFYGIYTIEIIAVRIVCFDTTQVPEDLVSKGDEAERKSL